MSQSRTHSDLVLDIYRPNLLQAILFSTYTRVSSASTWLSLSQVCFAVVVRPVVGTHGDFASSLDVNMECR